MVFLGFVAGGIYRIHRMHAVRRIYRICTPYGGYAEYTIPLWPPWQSAELNSNNEAPHKGSGDAPLGAERWHRRAAFGEKLRGCDGTRKTHLPLGFAAQLRKAFGPQWVGMHYTV